MSNCIDHISILQWGQRDGMLYYIDNVPNGLECNCLCSHCGGKLVAKNAGLIKEHHFAHFSGVECLKAVESAVHKLAKQVLDETKTLLLPPCEGNGPKGMQEYIPSSKIRFESVILEKSANTKNEKFRPDATGYVGGKQIFIEFCFTHEVSKEKLELIKATNTSCVEILLNAELQEFGKMEAFLHQATESKKWIFHRALGRLIEEHWQKAKARLEELNRKQSERDKQRKHRDEAKRKLELRRIERLHAQQMARIEKERTEKERELAAAETRGNLYKHCPIAGQFLDRFYQTWWGQNKVIEALQKGVWFQRKIFYYWPDKEIDIYVDKERHVLVPKKNDYDQLPEEQRAYHDYLLESVKKYDKLYNQTINYCSYCNMFVGNVQEFIVCKYNFGDDVARCLDFDKL
jgi:hypothetical protein